jgi:hypothetical protein
MKSSFKVRTISVAFVIIHIWFAIDNKIEEIEKIMLRKLIENQSQAAAT